jgi:hypothetical protein
VTIDGRYPEGDSHDREAGETRIEELAPAKPGDFGISPGGFRLLATALGAAPLQVGDLDRSLDFYRSLIGFIELECDGGKAHR